MTMNKKIKFLAVAFAALVMASCSTPKDVVYFQDLSYGQVVKADSVLDIRVKPEDKLSIIVNAQDPTLSSLFNLMQTSNRIQSTTSSTSKIGDSGNGGGGQMSYYTVNPQGDINFPVLGEMHISGMTRYEVAEYIRKRLIEDDLVKDPIVTVEFANTGVTVLGEVVSPGRYEFNKDHMTVLDAIAMAGDLTINGQRENLMVLRPDGVGKQQAYFIDLTDTRNVYSSPVFYLQQDDVVYVSPNKKKIRETTPNGNTPYTPSFWITMGSAAITVATLILTLTR